MNLSLHDISKIEVKFYTNIVYIQELDLIFVILEKCEVIALIITNEILQ